MKKKVKFLLAKLLFGIDYDILNNYLKCMANIAPKISNRLETKDDLVKIDLRKLGKKRNTKMKYIGDLVLKNNKLMKLAINDNLETLGIYCDYVRGWFE